MEREEKIAKIKKYFETPQCGVVANPRYAAFVLSLLEKVHPSFIDAIASYNLEGEVTLRWSIDLTVNLLNHVSDSDEEESEDPDEFDILILNFVSERPWSDIEISSSDQKKVADLFEVFAKSSTLEELIAGLGTIEK